MVFKKKLNYGSGFNVLNIPRAPRSCRRRAPFERILAEPEICAIELLALAGKLLQESESSASSNAAEGNHSLEIGKGVKEKQQDKCRVQKTEYIDQGSSDVNVPFSESTTGNNGQRCVSTGSYDSDGSGQHASMSGCLDNVGGESKPLEFGKLKPIFNSPPKLEDDSSLCGDSCDKVNNGLEWVEEAEGIKNGRLAVAGAFNSENSTECCEDFPKVVKTNENIKSSLRKDPVPNVSFQRHRKLTKKLGIRDDDENGSRFYKFSNKLKVYRPSSRVGDRRIRKLLSSKYWKLAPKLKDFECARVDGSLKSLHRKRKANRSYVRSQYENLYKRRKATDRNSVLTSDGGFSCESVSNSPEKDMKGDASNLAASRASSPVPGFHSKDSHVKVRIKSFKVPELFVQVPETATVGSLKRTVLEAVTALLGGGMRVGVVLRGKKIRDDNKTLSQTGISCKETLDNLGFTLEPAPKKASPSVFSGDPPLSLPVDAIDDSKRSLPILSDPNSCPNAEGLGHKENHAENRFDLAPPFTNTLTEEQPLSDCRALVPVPAMDVEALAVVPVNQKPKRSDMVQRRTRRPFSVSEVEALVQAVEELGTGRWRDVKLRAFENADHRTYVDLKDKWKTLVHTASISPQQRRGEPVPQDLLDRVLAAHAYWSQHQAKQHGKHHNGVPINHLTDEPKSALQGV